jgi:hypothetical protein
MTQTRWLDSRPIKAVLSRGAYDFGAMKERPITCYLCLPGNRLGTHNAWLRLMITGVVQKLLKDVRPAKVPVMLMLDEAALVDTPIIRNARRSCAAMASSFGRSIRTCRRRRRSSARIAGKASSPMPACCKASRRRT